MSSDEMNTAMFEQPMWLSPVERREDLPTEGVEPDILCFVEDEGAVYRFDQGEWTLEAARPR